MFSCIRPYLSQSGEIRMWGSNALDSFCFVALQKYLKHVFIPWILQSSMIDNDVRKWLFRDDVTFRSSSSWAWEASKHTRSPSLLGSFLLYLIVVEWCHGIFRALSITSPWPPNLLFRSREKNFIPLSGDVEDTGFVLATSYASCLGNVYHWSNEIVSERHLPVQLKWQP